MLIQNDGLCFFSSRLQLLGRRRGSHLPPDLSLIGSLALGLYAFTYYLLLRSRRSLAELLSALRKENHKAEESFVMSWAFRGRTEREDKLARLFTAVPPLMNILAFVAVVTIFLIALAFLKIETPIGTLIVTVMLAFPFYHAADSFDMSLMSRVAKRAGPALLSEEDTVWLEGANITLTNGLRFFRNLSFSFTLIVGVLGLAHVLIPNLSIASLWFACLACAAALSAVIAPRTGVGQIKYREDQTPEVALPMAGDHLSYGAPLTFSAHRTRLMKRFRRRRLSESEKDPRSKQ